jgi:hypothetical protein
MPLFWIKENRYYKIIFQPTLFGTIDIICAWGRIGGNLGNYKVVASKDEQDIELIIDAIKKRRRQRGYRLCS